MTEQEKQELIEYCEKVIATIEGRVGSLSKLDSDPHGVLSNLCKYLKIQQIALSSLKAEVAGYKWFHEGSPEVRGWYADCYALTDELLSKSDSISQYQPLYTALPATVCSDIKMPEDLVEHKSGLYGHIPTLTLQTADWAEGYREALMDVKLLNEVK